MSNNDDAFDGLADLFNRVRANGRRAADALTERRRLEAEVLRDFALVLEQTEQDEDAPPAAAAMSRGVLLTMVQTARDTAREIDGKGIVTLRDAAKALRDATPADE